MKKTFLIAFLSSVFVAQGQSGLSITAGTVLNIQPGNIFSVDGLVLTPTSTFTLSGSNSLMRNTTIAHPAPQPYISRVFQLAATSGSFSGTIAFYYSDAERNGIPENFLTLNVHNGTSWFPFPGGITRDDINNVVTTNGLSGISLNEITLANFDTPLPLQWGMIKAERMPNCAFISWETYNEVNTAFFQVERSLNGTQWNPIGSMVKALNSNGNHSYNLEDAEVTTALTYYRIRQIDADGHFSYSQVASIKALHNNTSVTVYPNPVIQKVQIQVALKEISALKLYAANGTLLRHEVVNKMNSYSLDLSALPKGSYLIEVELSNGEVSHHPIIKH